MTDYVFGDIGRLIWIVVGVICFVWASPYIASGFWSFVGKLGYGFSLDHPKSIHDVKLRHRFTHKADEERHQIYTAHQQMQTSDEINKAAYATALAQSIHAYQTAADPHILSHDIIEIARKHGVDSVIVQQLVAEHFRGHLGADVAERMEHLGADIHKRRTDIDQDRYRTENLTDLEILERAEKIKDKIARRNEARTRKADTRPKA